MGRMAVSRASTMGPVALVLGVPWLVRLLVWLELRADPFFRLLVVDARTYHETAVAMASGAYRLDTPFWQPPLYPFLLSLIYRVTGPVPDAMRMFQMALGSLSALLVYRIGRRLLGPRAAWVAWGAAAFHGALLFFDLQLLNASLATLLLGVGIERSLAWDEERRPRDLGLAGAAIGLASVTVATLLALIPVFAFWSGGRARAASSPGRLSPGRAPVRAAGWAAGLFLAAAAVPVLTVTAINLAASGQPVLVSYNGGINFWIGNNPDYERTVAIRPGRAWQALTQEPVEAGARSESETSSWFFRRSMRWIAAEPAAWLGLTARKARLFLRGDELARNQEIYPFRAESFLLRSLLWTRGLAFPTGILLPLGLAGMALWFRRRTGSEERRRAGLGLLTLLFLAHGVAVTLFFPAARYRLPVIPPLILLAVAGGAFLVEAARQRRWRAMAIPGAALVAGALLANTGLPPMPVRFHGDTYADLGTQHFEQGDLDGAARWYGEALVVDPENAEAAHNLGAIWLHRRQPDRAEPLLRRVLARWPADPKALINLGNCFLQRGEPYRAGRYFQQVLETNPASPDAAGNLELAREQADRLERERMAADPAGFVRGLERLLAREPQNAFLRARLERLRTSRSGG